VAVVLDVTECCVASRSCSSWIAASAESPVSGHRREYCPVPCPAQIILNGIHVEVVAQPDPGSLVELSLVADDAAVARVVEVDAIECGVVDMVLLDDQLVR
jgi:hypothetical protein